MTYNVGERVAPLGRTVWANGVAQVCRVTEDEEMGRVYQLWIARTFIELTPYGASLLKAGERIWRTEHMMHEAYCPVSSRSAS